MCTALILRRAGPPASLVVAANRDEFLRRPAVGPTVLLEQPRAVGGLDLEQRGSWFGVTAGGLLALLTNQPEPDGRPHAGRRTRGEIVMGALRQGSRVAARAWLAELDGRDYNSFNLLFGDAIAAEVAYGRSDRRELEFELVPEGLSVLPNGRLDEAGHVKVARARHLVEPAVDAPWPELRRALVAALADHERAPLEALPEPSAGARFSREAIRDLSALCIHMPEYGTRSSSISLVEPGEVRELWYAAGPACRTEFLDATALLAG
jgi:uncharacterized protein with NRDE domain